MLILTNVRNILTLFNVPIVYGGNGLVKVKSVVLDSNLVVLLENVIIIAITCWTCCLRTLFISFQPALPYYFLPHCREGSLYGPQKLLFGRKLFK